MLSSFWKAVAFVVVLLAQLVAAQQYAGDYINTTAPLVPGSELVYFKIREPNGKTPKAYNLTLMNYQTLQLNGKQMVPSQVKRAVIIIHGLNRDPGTYISNIQSAFAQLKDSTNSITRSNVLMMAPYFPNGDDRNTGKYPFARVNPNTGATLSGAAQSYTGALVWQGSQWAGGGVNQYPAAYKTVSSYEVLDQLIQWFGNKAVFPNMKQIVIAGHSLGAQTVQRYAIAGKSATQLGVSVPVTYWIANPNSYAWLNSSRPLPTASCPDYDDWRDGLFNVTGYMGSSLYNTAVTSSVSAMQQNYFSKSKAYARGLLDSGDDSSGCAPATSGANRNERFFAFINWWKPTCASPTSASASAQCDTVDFANIGHDGGSMMASTGGQARLFTDNFNGTGVRSYDVGYPRQQQGDDPYPNPELASEILTDKTVYAGNMTAQGCYSDPPANRALPFKAYESNTNTIQSCTSACARAGYTIAGVENGNQCYCGNAITGSSSKVVNTACNQPCSGNSSQTCGQVARLNIFSNGAPKQLSPPGNPDSTADLNYNFLNCYSETSSGPRALSAKTYADTKNMTLDNCASFCAGYQYFGIEYSQECYCGGCFNGNSAIIAASSCSMTCTGDATQYCGGGGALTVYELDPDSSLKPIAQTCNAASTTTTGPAVPTTTISAANLCPNADGQNIVDASNNTYRVACSSDSNVGSYSSSSATSSYLDCMGACDAAATSGGCVAFTYVGAANGNGAGTCYLKSAVGSFVSAGTNLISAVRVGSNGISSSASTTVTTSTSASASASSAATNLCPSADGQNIVDAGNNTYRVTCSSDSNVGSYASTSASNSYLDCMTACDAATGGCTAFTYVGAANGGGSGTCYLKTSIGSYVPSGSNLISAVRVASNGGSSSSSSSVSGSSTTSSTSSSTSTSAPSGPTNLCPNANGQSIVVNNATYRITCSSDSSVGSYAAASATTSYLDCMSACDAASSTGCIGFTYVGAANGAGSGTCYLKTSMGRYVSSGANLISAVKVASNGGSSSSTTVSGTSTTSSSTAVSSSTATTTSSSTSASSAATTSAVSCPASDGITYSSTTGAQFVIECGIDHAGGDLSSLSVEDFAGCINACATTSGCVDVSLSGSACYLKSAVGPAVNNGVWGARLISQPVSSSSSTSSSSTSSTTAGVSSTSSDSLSSSSTTTTTTTSSQSSTTVPTSTTTTSTSTSSAPAVTQSALSCPASNGATYTAASGATFQIECNIDHSGGDMGMKYVNKYEDCIEYCASTSGCVDVSLAGSACYIKRTLGAAVNANGVRGAKLISGPPSSSTSTTSFASPPVNVKFPSSSAESSSSLTSSSTSASDSTTSSSTTSSIDSSSSTSTSSTSDLQTTSSTQSTSETSSATTTTPVTSDVSTSTTSQTSTFTTTSSTFSSSLTTSSTTSDFVSTTTSESSSAISSPAVTSSTSSTSTSSSSSSSTTSVAPTAPAIVGDYSYQGCYNDTVSGRALRSKGVYGTTSNPMTLEKCAIACGSYNYFGVEYASECFCGDILYNNSQNGTAKAVCRTPCPGNSTELCGGSNAIQMYSKIASSSSSSATSTTTSFTTTSTKVSTTADSSTTSAPAQFRRRGMRGYRPT